MAELHTRTLNSSVDLAGCPAVMRMAAINFSEKTLVLSR